MLEFRKTVRSDYADVITPDAVARPRSAGAFRRGPQAVDGRAHSAPRRTRVSTAADRFLDPESTIGGTSIKVRDARDGKFIGSEIPRDLQTAVDPGHRTGGPAGRLG